MRYFFLVVFLLLTFNCLQAQVGINTTTPDPSSMLDITATDKGMLIPRMTEVQRTAITTPATGLLVYQTDNTDGFWYFNGVSWLNLSGGADNDWNIIGSNLEAAVTGSVTASEMQISNTGRGTGFGGISNKNVPSQTTDYALLQNDNGTTYLNSGGGNALHFRTDNTERMTLSNRGNLGIGNTIPSAMLTIGQSPDGRDLVNVFGESTSPIPLTMISQTSGITTKSTVNLINTLKSQSFVATSSGILKSITIRLSKEGTLFSSPELFDIKVVLKNNSGTVLETVISSANLGGDWTNKTFNFSSVNLIAGNSYSFEVTRDSGTKNVFMDYTNLNLYPDGLFNSNTANDAYMVVVVENTLLSSFNVKSNGNVGIGTSTPDVELHIAGSLKLVDGTQGAGKVLTSSGTGLASWQDASTLDDGDWTVSGSNLIAGVTGSVTASEMQISNTGRTSSFGGIYNKDVNSQTTDYALLQSDGGETFLNSGGGNALHFRANNTERMTLTNGGDLGIGTTAPIKKFDVLTGTSGEGIVIRSSTTASNVAGHFYPGTNGFVIDTRLGDLTGSKNFHIRTGGTDRLFVSGATGNVGVGTTNPTQAKLVVNGSETTALTGSFLNSAGTIGTTGGSVTLSGYFFNSVAAETFRAFSDARIKNIQGISNSEKDLATLAKIEVTDYQLKDTIAKGNKAFKKVIAQQVAAVYPQAVTNDLTDVIPNIYKLSEIKDGVIVLSTDLTVGDKVKLIFSEGEELVDVTEVAKNSFKVATEKQGKVFVYGKQVNDFHTVDYEAISMLNVSATQALLKRIENLEKKNNTLETALLDIKKKNNTLEATLLNVTNQNKTLEKKQIKNNERLNKIETYILNTTKINSSVSEN